MCCPVFVCIGMWFLPQSSSVRSQTYTMVRSHAIRPSLHDLSGANPFVMVLYVNFVKVGYTSTIAGWYRKVG